MLKSQSPSTWLSGTVTPPPRAKRARLDALEGSPDISLHRQDTGKKIVEAQCVTDKMQNVQTNIQQLQTHDVGSTMHSCECLSDQSFQTRQGEGDVQVHKLAHIEDKIHAWCSRITDHNKILLDALSNDIEAWAQVGNTCSDDDTMKTQNLDCSSESKLTAFPVRHLSSVDADIHAIQSVVDDWVALGREDLKTRNASTWSIDVEDSPIASDQDAGSCDGMTSDVRCAGHGLQENALWSWAHAAAMDVLCSRHSDEMRAQLIDRYLGIDRS